VFRNVSMGGAIAVHVASRQKLAALSALVVIDVVEGLTQLVTYYLEVFYRRLPRHYKFLDCFSEFVMHCSC